MSVIWSGVTEEGAVVPVQVTAEGKVVAIGDGPQGDYLPTTGGNLTGDLTLATDKITLNATNGAAEFAGNVQIGPVNLSDTANTGVILWKDVGITSIAASGPVFRGYATGGTTSTSLIGTDGSAEFAGRVTAGSNRTAGLNDPGIVLESKQGSIFGYITDSSKSFYAGYFGTDLKIDLKSDGSATFSGDVVIGSRGTKWLIRESNGVAMLIEQTRRGIEPRTPEKVRDLPNELDLIETALNEVMAKLKMVPPAGWPVWDGQDEVTSDNDNA